MAVRESQDHPPWLRKWASAPRNPRRGELWGPAGGATQGGSSQRPSAKAQLLLQAPEPHRVDLHAHLVPESPPGDPTRPHDCSLAPTPASGTWPLLEAGIDSLELPPTSPLHLLSLQGSPQICFWVPLSPSLSLLEVGPRFSPEGTPCAAVPLIHPP